MRQCHSSLATPATPGAGLANHALHAHTRDRSGRLSSLIPVCLVWVLSMLLLAGCSSGDEERELTRLRIAVLPDESAEELVERFEPIREHLEDKLGIPCEIIVPKSYESLVDRFVAGDFELAYFGGYSFVSAHQQAGAVPLVLREQDRQFVSYFIVAGDNPKQSLNDFKGERIAFGSRLSTSGHVMPRYFLMNRDIVPEDFFGQVIYTGKHDATAYAVRDGKAEIGAVNSLVFDDMIKDGRLAQGSVRVLEQTPPYVDYVWACRSDLSKPTRDSITDAFLMLSTDNKQHRAVLESLRTETFLPARLSEFESLQAAFDQVEKLEENP